MNLTSTILLNSLFVIPYSLFIRHWLLPGVWGLIIIALSLMPGGPGQLKLFGIPHIDKIGHFGMYAIWTFLVYRALSADQHFSLRKSFWISVLIGGLAGVILECGQYFMGQGRSFELTDMVANAAGAVAGAITSQWIRKSSRRVVS